MFSIKAGAFPSGTHFRCYPWGMLPALPANIHYNRLQRPARDKHSSLLGSLINYSCKKFPKIGLSLTTQSIGDQLVQGNNSLVAVYQRRTLLGVNLLSKKVLQHWRRSSTTVLSLPSPLRVSPESSLLSGNRCSSWRTSRLARSSRPSRSGSFVRQRTWSRKKTGRRLSWTNVWSQYLIGYSKRFCSH